MDAGRAHPLTPQEPAPDEELLPTGDRQTTAWNTVLAAAGCEYRLARRGEGWVILVPRARAAAARREIAAYESDETAARRKPSAALRADPALNPGISPLGVSALLIVFYARLGPYHGDDLLLRAAASDSAAILAGEWWRVITALTIHAGGGHLAGNIFSLALLGWAVGRLFGGGLGWVLILTAGIAGNLATAWLGGGGGPVSVGASTSVFGALGLLAGQRAMHHWKVFGSRGGIWNRAWLPLAAALALLGLLGAGPRSDLAAHTMGFVAGIVLGVPFGLRPPPRWTVGSQRLLQLAGLLIILGAWRAAVVSLR